jgi:hypothetical protein
LHRDEVSVDDAVEAEASLLLAPIWRRLLVELVAQT